MRKNIILLLLLLGISAQSQQKDSGTSRQVYLKANALFLPVGIINAGAEFQVGKKMTLQPEIFVSPWKSFSGKYFQVYMAGMDARYYFDEAFNHWYVGANISFTRFIMQKWNYWHDGPFQYEPDSPIYTTSDLYQDGYSIIIGAVVGYQFKIAENWNMDLYVGAGSSQSEYKGYHKVLGVRYDSDPNRSGEFIPYKGGVMISYKLR